MKVKILKAFNGDCILISFKDDENNDRNILIDGGTPNTYQFKNHKNKIEPGDLKLLIKDIKEKGQLINLLILTHVDDDHIGGILKWFENDAEASKLVSTVWFNSGRLISEFFKEEEIKENLLQLNITSSTNTSIGQGVAFEDYIESKKIWDRQIISDKQKLQKFGIEFTMLSPGSENLKLLLKKWEKEKPDSLTSGKENDYATSLKEYIANDIFKEDNAKHNGSSIAFILTYRQKNLLFLADAHPSVIMDSLSQFGYSKENPLQAEFVKIAHHGSKANNSRELLEMIQSDKFIISSNGDKHNLPNKQFLARLISIHNNCKIYFNYPDLIKRIFSEKDHIDFPEFKALPIAINHEFQL